MPGQLSHGGGGVTIGAVCQQQHIPVTIAVVCHQQHMLVTTGVVCQQQHISWGLGQHLNLGGGLEGKQAKPIAEGRCEQQVSLRQLALKPGACWFGAGYLWMSALGGRPESPAGLAAHLQAAAHSAAATPR
jgi:hypothetical protein